MTVRVSSNAAIGVSFAKLKTTAANGQNLELAGHDFKLTPLLEDDEIESILGRIDEFVSWANDIKDCAL